ncbi:hypothetical protein CBR_g22066 [Chara braunii]|uniref:Uncharacterized protein n=1 Tax=Chara braunii TaxID=69332 RepID=A0A388L1Z9_CHABU|nr:hypothetical protein CBR_g22066 [Chara braunii]|eukprot:GBG76319.1 hypothetical protein CBR_g22066 [Chara braunii]
MLGLENLMPKISPNAGCQRSLLEGEWMTELPWSGNALPISSCPSSSSAAEPAFSYVFLDVRGQEQACRVPRISRPLTTPRVGMDGRWAVVGEMLHPSHHHATQLTRVLSEVVFTVKGRYAGCLKHSMPRISPPPQTHRGGMDDGAAVVWEMLHPSHHATQLTQVISAVHAPVFSPSFSSRFFSFLVRLLLCWCLVSCILL